MTSRPFFTVRVTAAILLILLAVPSGLWAADDHSHHMHSLHAVSSVSRSEAAYAMPAVSLRNQDGVSAAFPALVDDGRPVLLNFIYTSCTAICPPMTRIFAEVREGLGADRARVRMVSVSIDPEQDTPARLKAYARQYGAGVGTDWLFLTGSDAASSAVQKAFNAYRPDKMGHTPVSFLRRAPGQPWVRLDGMAQADRILAELRPMLAR